MILGIGGFFKALWGGLRKILPFLGKALDNPIIKAVLISKLGTKAVQIIIAIVTALEEEAIVNETKHAYARDQIRAAFATENLPQPSDNYLDIHIAMAVKKLRGTGELVAYER